SNYPFSELHFADVDGNGRADVLRFDGSEWMWSQDGKKDWAPRNTTPAGTTDLKYVRVGKFVGNDDKLDAFYTTGTLWLVANGRTGDWIPINVPPLYASELGFGDFNGDKTTDVFW